VKGTSKAVKVSAQEEELLSAAQAGHEWAFIELCYHHSSRILFTLYRITKTREDAEDAFQESVLKAFVHFGDFNRASSFATWLTRISVNSALMILRSDVFAQRFRQTRQLMKARVLFNGKLRIEVPIRRNTTFNLKTTGFYGRQFPNCPQVTGAYLRFAYDRTAR
jgi:hypothetical protein